jgi:hypothetical protein
VLSVRTSSPIAVIIVVIHRRGATESPRRRRTPSVSKTVKGMMLTTAGRMKASKLAGLGNEARALGSCSHWSARLLMGRRRGLHTLHVRLLEDCLDVRRIASQRGQETRLTSSKPSRHRPLAVRTRRRPSLGVACATGSQERHRESFLRRHWQARDPPARRIPCSTVSVATATHRKGAARPPCEVAAAAKSANTSSGWRPLANATAPRASWSASPSAGAPNAGLSEPPQRQVHQCAHHV